jgi:Ca2+-binding EF-hand superfamily protein
MLALCPLSVPGCSQSGSGCGGNSAEPPTLVPGGAVEAESEGEAEPAPEADRWLQRIVERLDSDEDGVLKVSELPEGEWSSQLAAADTDEDGTLSEDELRAHFAESGTGWRGPGRGRWSGRGGPQSPQQIIERLDSDGDGVLNVSELGDGRRGRFLSGADEDEDGTLTVEEIQAHLDARRAQWGGPPEQTPEEQQAEASEEEPATQPTE